MNILDLLKKNIVTGAVINESKQNKKTKVLDMIEYFLFTTNNAHT